MTDENRIRWILVTGASNALSQDEAEAACEVGAMLAREAYGLIVGDWDGVDWLVRQAFLELVPESEQSHRIIHVANYRRRKPFRVPKAPVLGDDGDDPNYSLSSIMAADAGVIVSGREGSKPSMDALLRHKKPVLPVPFLGWDSFEVYRDILANWNEQPVPGLTETQFLELMRPWKRNPLTLARLIRAALTVEPRIFVSYRRQDVPAAAGRVFDELAHAYGHRAVFIDYANLALGDELGQILERVRESRVLVAIIGPNWDTARLQNEEDYVRRELEEARKANRCVIPLLIGRTTPPQREEIPESLRFVWDCNFAAVQMDDWSHSIAGLRHAVDKGLKQ